MVDDAEARRAREWRLIPEEPRPGPMQMALDEVAAQTAATGGPRTLRVYRWEPSCLSLGYSQDPETIDWDACASRNLDVTRRQTGGGAIYHDAWGDISYSIVAPAEELPGALIEAYHVLCEPLFEALDTLGVAAAYSETEQAGLYEPACYLRSLHPAHDIVVDGRKISGNAQYRQRDAVVQHGSLLYDLAPEAHAAGFAAPPGPSAFRERVTAVSDVVDVSRSAVVTALEETFEQWAGAAVGAWTPEELQTAQTLADEKYRATSWVRAGEDPT
jgi:lipoate-protein ligase A